MSSPSSGAGVEEEELSKQLQSVSVSESVSASPSPSLSSALSSAPSVVRLVLDVGFGWPTQKKPRKERINAVARQLVNYCKSGASDDASKLLVVGQAPELDPLRLRFTQLMEKADEPRLLEVVDFEVGDCFEMFGGGGGVGGAGYLSPDSETTLDVGSAPPPVLIVGALVDRSVTVGRSKRRASSNNCQSAQLPLELTRLEGLANSEPCNIDTILEICSGWAAKWNKEGGKDKGEDRNRKCFVDAAVSALLRHEERHPNRTLHME